ncbi:crossover junction endodeoxyribonuclease RuvC [Anaeromyxobacter oryzae]|uniref:Crossover junction endodeoxyribonuclease RuvC n=1 Tax=Anaeromyxobacter oryzae TaxID=2918170 RepID=A0ABN6MYQ4_9BACT|nr:crossover junction endodeoxyribonuclease RuvC [Anaeromyxobacter oryzae]BDG04693.1 crossover junction endodeoxyribonuclease RuvC [Anaeromyxobacter oryzae]
MIVLGIDPGSRRCGFGVVEREGARLRVVESGVLEPGDLPIAVRLGRILDGLDAVIARARPAEVSVEAVFCGASPRSALVLGQARGVALAVAARAGLPVFEYAPAEVKLAFTGNGRAGKDQMLRTARMLLGASPDLSDEADALALAVCHLARRPLRLATAAGKRGAASALARLVPARRDHRRSAP